MKAATPAVRVVAGWWVRFGVRFLMFVSAPCIVTPGQAHNRIAALVLGFISIIRAALGAPGEHGCRLCSSARSFDTPDSQHRDRDFIAACDCAGDRFIRKWGSRAFVRDLVGFAAYCYSMKLRFGSKSPP